jgi:hypothetical protein
MRLTAVSQHLQTMAFNASDTFQKASFRGGKYEKQQTQVNDAMQKMMNPTVQSNLDLLLKDQMQQI